MIDEFETLILNIEPRLGPGARQTLEKLRQEFQLTGDQANQVARQIGTNLAPMLDNLERNGTKASVGIARVRNAMATLALQATGMQGPLGSVASSLLMFSAGSATVIGIAAGLALIRKAYQDLVAPIEAAQKAADDAQRRLAGTLRDQDQGANPVRFASEQLAAAEAEQRRLQDRIANTSRLGKLLPGFAEDEANLSAVTADVQALRVGLEQATDAATKAGQKIKDAFDERQAAKAEALAKAASAFTRQLTDLANSATATVLDDLGTAMQRLREEAEKLGVAGPKLDAALKVFQDKIDVAKVTEGIGNVDSLATIEEVQAALESLKDLRERGLDVTEATNKLLERQKVLTGEIADNVARQQDEATTFTGGLETAAQVKRTLEEQLSVATNVARGVLGIAQAFGLANDKAAAVLQNVIGIADALPSVLSGNPAAILGVVGSLVGAISSLFGGGTSPEELARRKVLEDNTAALERVRDGLENLGGGLTGNQRASASRISQRAIGLIDDPSVFLPNDILSVAQAKNAFGLTARELRDLQAVADEFGITLDGTKKSWEDLNAAINANDLTRFTKTFAGQSAATDIRNRLFDITGTAALQNVASNAAAFSPALSGLAGLDLSTAAGRAAAEALLQKVFEDVNAGRITNDQLGGLSIDDLNATLVKIEELIDDANNAAKPLAANESFTISRSITEVTGERIGSLIATAADYGRRTAEATELIAALMLNGSSLVPAAVGAAGLSGRDMNRYLGDQARAAALRAGNTTVS